MNQRTGILWGTWLFLCIAGAQGVLADAPLPESLTFCGEPVPLDHADVRERLETRVLALLMDEPQIELYHRRMARWFPLFEREIAAAGLPDDLKYVAVAESGLRPFSRSPVRALGLWQLMPGTAREHGLTVNDTIDERLDVLRATRVALKLLESFHERFGSWPTALAAYNLGPSRVYRETLEQGTRDYYSLVLPNETDIFVFQIMAIKLILEHPERYGLDPSGWSDFAPYGGKRTALKLLGKTPGYIIADLLGLSYREFRLRNPHLLGAFFGPGEIHLYLDEGQLEPLIEGITAWRKAVTGVRSWGRSRRFIVKSGPARIRIGPDVRFSIYKELEVGEGFAANGETAVKYEGRPWYRILLGRGHHGWIWAGVTEEQAGAD
jgi:hypothetical protein